MPATLKSLTAKVDKLDIKIDDDPKAISISYNPRLYTARLEQEVAEAAKNNLPAGSLVPAIRQLVTEWNLRPDKEEPIIELTTEALLDIPAELLFSIVDQIGEQQNPDPLTKEP